MAPLEIQVVELRNRIGGVLPRDEFAILRRDPAGLL
jgi:hypothetical protein